MKTKSQKEKTKRGIAAMEELKERRAAKKVSKVNRSTGK